MKQREEGWSSFFKNKVGVLIRFYVGKEIMEGVEDVVEGVSRLSRVLWIGSWD